MAVEAFGGESSWQIKGKKAGGARGVGEYGGIYTNGQKTALIKQDEVSLNFDIAEYMSSRIFAAVSPGTGAVVEMMVPEGQEAGIPGDGSNVYVRSEFFDNYTDMDQHMSAKNKPSKWFRKDGRPLFMGTRQVLGNVMGKAIGNLGYEGFDKIAPGSLLVGDFDMHTGNIGVIREVGKKPQLKRIDFGWGFANLTRDIHPHSASRHLPGQGPTNHFREFPRKYKLTEEFVEGLNQSASADIATVLAESFSELEKYYNRSVLQKWAQHAMPNEFGDKNVDEIDLAEVRSTLKEVMQARQASLKEFSIEIKLGLIAETTKKGLKKNYTIDRAELKKLVKENPDYFKEILSGEKKLRLRDKKLRKSKIYKKLLKQEIAEVRNEIIKEGIALEAERVRNPQVVVPSPVLDQRPRLPESLQEQIRDPNSQPKNQAVARDSVRVGGQPSIAPSVNLNDVIDPITQAIRTEIIVAQQSMLQQEIAKGMEGAEKIAFTNKNSAEIQKYLKTKKGKEAVAEVMSSPEFQIKMHQVESAGYHAVHTKFKSSFRDVAWEGQEANQVRSTNIINNDGQEVCTLKKTTISAQPVSLNLSDGTVKIVKSYRQIDFPKGLEAEHGPLHLSLALKDENGRNMPEKNAVYFTAHYDDSGKLTEVSSPIPVKFMGAGEDAIGYIERDGKVYTLPVTQGKYHEMMKEVAKNHGMNVDLTQGVEKPEQLVVDQVTVVAEQSVKPAKKSRATPKQLREQLAAIKKKAAKSVVIPSVRPEQSEADVQPKAVAKRIKARLVPEVEARDLEKEAIQQLKNASKTQVKTGILAAIKAGDEQLVGAMMEVLNNPPEGVTPIGTVALKGIYFEGKALASNASGAKAAKIERACGKMASSAKVRHDTNSTKDNSVPSR